MFNTLTGILRILEPKDLKYQEIVGLRHDGLTDGIFRLLRKDTSIENSTLIEKYDRMMASLSMAKATRLLHLRTLLSLSRMLGKNWYDGY